jgi:hypothetical protein
MNNTDRATFINLIADIAGHLDGVWILKEYPAEWTWGGTLTEAHSGAILELTAGGYRNPEHVHVRSELPKTSKGESPHVGLQYGQKMPEINVSSKKTGAQIANDIERRLLPQYLPLLDKAHTVIAQHEAFHDKTENMAAQIAKILRVPPDKKSRVINFYNSPLPAFHENLGQATVGADEVELNLRLDYNTTLQILKLLAKS